MGLYVQGTLEQWRRSPDSRWIANDGVYPAYLHPLTRVMEALLLQQVHLKFRVVQVFHEGEREMAHNEPDT